MGETSENFSKLSSQITRSIDDKAFSDFIAFLNSLPHQGELEALLEDPQKKEKFFDRMGLDDPAAVIEFLRCVLAHGDDYGEQASDLVMRYLSYGHPHSSNAYTLSVTETSALVNLLMILDRKHQTEILGLKDGNYSVEDSFKMRRDKPGVESFLKDHGQNASAASPAPG